MKTNWPVHQQLVRFCVLKKTVNLFAYLGNNPLQHLFKCRWVLEGWRQKRRVVPSWSSHSLLSGTQFARSSGVFLLLASSRWAAKTAGSFSSHTSCKCSPASAWSPPGLPPAVPASSDTELWHDPSAQTQRPAEKQRLPETPDFTTQKCWLYIMTKNRKLCLRTGFWNEMFSYCFLNQCILCVTQNCPWQIISEYVFCTDAGASQSQRRCLPLPKAQKGYFIAAVIMKARRRSRHWRSTHKLHFTFISVLSDSSLLSCSSMFCTRPSSRSCCLISMACAKKTRR